MVTDPPKLIVLMLAAPVIRICPTKYTVSPIAKRAADGFCRMLTDEFASALATTMRCSKPMPSVRVRLGVKTAVPAVMPDALPSHEGAFAITVHKSQGSEYGHVAVLLPPDLSGAHATLLESLVEAVASVDPVLDSKLSAAAKAIRNQLRTVAFKRATGLAE